MKCMKCGADNPDTQMFCRSCGEELFSGENVAVEDKTFAEKPDPVDVDEMEKAEEEKKERKKSELKNLIRKKEKPAPKKKQPRTKGDDPSSPSGDNKKRSGGRKISPKRIGVIVKLILGAAAVAAVIILIVSIVSWVNAGKGMRIAEKVPIGRNIDYCRKETEEEFPSSSRFPQLKTVASFNYVCEDEKSVNISGITVPRWAVLVTTGTGNTISQVEYFDFEQLSDGWKGYKSNILLTKETVSYGMDEKSVKKAIGFEPYYVKKNADNRTLQCYRYYIIDNDTGTERVYNYFVEYNDVNGTVVNAYDREIKYVSYFLGISG